METDLESLDKLEREVEFYDDDTSDPSTRSSRPAVKCGDGISFNQGLFISLNYNLNFSALVFPFHIARSGWSGFLIFSLAGLATYLTARFIADIMHAFPDIQTYSDIGVKASQAIFGQQHKFATRCTKIFFRIFQQMALFTFLIFGYLIVQGSLSFAQPDLSADTVLLLSNVLLLPTVLFTLSPKLLSYAGMSGTVLFVAIYVLMLVTGIAANVEGEYLQVTAKNATLIEFHPESIVDFYGAYGGILLLFCGHAVYPTIFSELEDKKDMYRVVNYTYALVVATTVPMSVLLILGYGKHAITDLPTGYLEGTDANLVGQVMMMLKAILAQAGILYPIMFELSKSIHRRIMFRYNSNTQKVNEINILDMESQPSAESWHTEDEYKNDRRIEGPSKVLKLLVGFVVILLSFGASVILPSLALVISINGAIFAISLNLTFPSLSFLITIKKKTIKRKLAVVLVMAGLASSGISLVYVFS